jgi:hypothetical protein
MVAFASFVILPATVFAQATLSGFVKDTSGAVLPGVNVEASSPVLIEKVRTGVSDSTGLYRIPDLPPGIYKVTFTLPGFATVSREGVEVTGSGVTTINADMRVGALTETITVTGESPVVDTQTSTRRQMVLSNSVVQAIPASRGYGNLLATVPGIQATGLDVSSGVSTNFFTARGGRGNEGTIQIDGMNVGSAFNGGGVAGFGYPIGESSEIQVTISGGLGEVDRGGPAFNLIPKTGGNTFSGTGFLSVAGKWSQGNNLDDQLIGYGLTQVPGLIKNWDTNFAIGGPIIKDRLWFYNNVRSYGNHQEIPGLFGNKNAGDQSKWFYDRDDTLTARGAAAKMIEAIRLTGQATPRNKVGFYLDYQNVCNGSAYAKGAQQCRDRGDNWIALGSVGAGFFGALAPEAGNVWDNREKITQFTWSSPYSNKLLLEAGFSQFASRFGGQIPGGALTDFIPVQEQSTLGGVPVGNFTYRGWSSAGSNEQFHNVWRASGTYVTGAHSLKIGYQAAFQVQKNFQNAGSQISYVFNNRTPIQFTLRDAPFWQSNRTRFDAIYIRISGHADDSRCKAPCATSTRGAGSPRVRTASSPTTSSARSICFPSRTASPVTTTSRLEWAPPTTCLETARPRSRATSASTCRPQTMTHSTPSRIQRSPSSRPRTGRGPTRTATSSSTAICRAEWLKTTGQPAVTSAARGRI